MLLHVRNLLGIILLLRFAAKGKAEDILVTVDEGTLLGTTATSLYNTTYTAFLGIPYAEPPLGALRFAAPQPAAGWDGVRNATQYGSDCVQEDGSGSEDCLYLNVYVPGVPEEGAKLPVMFWVHGGGYVRGGGSSREYGPDLLVSYGVILVTINYRLGAFGLFSRVIIQSGNFIGHPNPLEYARWNSFRLGAILGLETNNSQELVEFLRSRDTADLVVDNSVILTDELKVLYIYEVWSPHVEPDLDGSFLAESSIQTFIDGRFHRVPIMTGVTSGELGYKMVNDTEKVEILNNQFVKSVAPCLHLATAQQQQEAAHKMREFYFGNGTVSVDNPDPVVDFNNDMMFFEPTDALVRKVSELSDTPVFYYEFDYRGKIVQSTNWGVNHAGDIFVLFVRDDTVCNLDPESEEDQVRRNMVRYWTNFAKYGNPTPEADPVIWEPYNNVTRSYMLMQSNFSLAHNKDAERMDFWHENVPLQPYADNFWRHV
ncbi:carboxylesterase 5A-like isoform X2 [Schistocerca americana]|uniref:carboxylesterase 5A-like isoform X2 n=1 Tax=Schistocerca americana TaxID=7009 RepID=UPI001F4F8EC6|nr:carboxylesterase 5A-like isoform X2 [Schistocerca americana]